MKSTQGLLASVDELDTKIKIIKRWGERDGQGTAGEYSELLATHFGDLIMNQPSSSTAGTELMALITATFLLGYHSGQEDFKLKKLLGE